MMFDEQVAKGVKQFLEQQAQDAAEFKALKWLIHERILAPNKIVMGRQESLYWVQSRGYNLFKDPSYVVCLGKVLDYLDKLKETPSDAT
jgi:hypothetical protein